jgi:hypothetical protein
VAQTGTVAWPRHQLFTWRGVTPPASRGKGSLSDIRVCQQGGEGDAGEGVHVASIERNSMQKTAPGHVIGEQFGLAGAGLPPRSQRSRIPADF